MKSVLKTLRKLAYFLAPAVPALMLGLQITYGIFGGGKSGGG